MDGPWLTTYLQQQPPLAMQRGRPGINGPRLGSERGAIFSAGGLHQRNITNQDGSRWQQKFIVAWWCVYCVCRVEGTVRSRRACSSPLFKREPPFSFSLAGSSFPRFFFYLLCCVRVSSVGRLTARVMRHTRIAYFVHYVHTAIT